MVHCCLINRNRVHQNFDTGVEKQWRVLMMRSRTALLSETGSGVSPGQIWYRFWSTLIDYFSRYQNGGCLWRVQWRIANQRSRTLQQEGNQLRHNSTFVGHVRNSSPHCNMRALRQHSCILNVHVLPHCVQWAGRHPDKSLPTLVVTGVSSENIWQVDWRETKPMKLKTRF